MALTHADYGCAARHVVGAGLAGCEAAWQLAERGIDVMLVEQKPIARTPAQTTRQAVRARLLELDARRGAVERRGALEGGAPPRGLARHGVRGQDRRCPRAARSPSTARLRGRTSRARLASHPRMRIEHRVVERSPSDATTPSSSRPGPLTGDALAKTSRASRRRGAPRVLRRDRAHRRDRIDRTGFSSRAGARGRRSPVTTSARRRGVRQLPVREAAVRRVRRGSRRGREGRGRARSKTPGTSRGACPSR